MSTPSTTETTKKRRRWPWIILAAVLVGGALVVAGLWWFFRDDSPPPVSLDDAVGSLGSTTSAPSGSGPVAGTWAVDPSLGEFSFDDATGSFVGFRIKEELQGIGSTTAVGRTPAVSGTITIDGTTLTVATFEADMTSITTNESRRDSRVQGALDTGTFPTATFALTKPVDLGAAAESGGPVSVDAVGDLTIHGVTKQVSVPVEAQKSGDTIVVVGSLPVVFSDFGVAVPKAPVVVSAEDNGLVELQLLFTRQA